MTASNVEYYDPFNGKLGFAFASRHRGLIYVSGMTGFAKDMSVPEGLEAQIRQAYENIERILGHYGASLAADTVEQVVFVVGDAEAGLREFGTVARDVFADSPPPCTLVGVTSLVDPRYKVEIKVTAIDPESR